MPRLLKWCLIIGIPCCVLGANWSMPGSWLYPAKLNVTEPIWSATISFLPKTSADWAVILIQRRLIEAGILANQGKLNALDIVNYKSKINDRLDFVKAKITDMSSSTDRLLDGAAVASNLEAVYNGGIDGIKQKSDNNDIKDFVDLLSTQQQDISTIRAGIEDSITQKIDEHSAFTVMDNKLYELDQNIRTVQLTLDNNRSNLSDEQFTGAGKLLDASKTGLEEARGLHNGEQSKFAFVAANKAERAELEAKVFLDIMTYK